MTIDIDSLSSLDLGFSVFQPEGKGSMSTRVCVVFLLSRRNTLQLQSRNLKPPLPIIPFDIVAYAYALFRDNLSQNSCKSECNVKQKKAKQ